MSLAETLNGIRQASAAKFSADIVGAMTRAKQELRSSGIVERALKTGAFAPHFSAPNQDGETVNSMDLLKRGPLVVTFYRGVW